MSKHLKRLVAPVATLFVAAGVLAATASAAPPQNTAAPTLSGQTREGSTLTTSNGTWSNTPTSYTYQWQRCDAAGANCANITGATAQSYTLTAADVDRRVRSVVTARNADGSASANSAPSNVVSSTNAPANTAKPTITGTPTVGNDLTANNGTWTGGVTSYTYQWQRCPGGTTTACVNIAGATAKTYTVRTADVASALRVNVTAHNASSTATASSDPTSVVGQNTTTVVQTTTTSTSNATPTLRFLSLKVRANRVYVRFRVCDDSPKVTVIDRDVKYRHGSYTRRFQVVPNGCATYSRSWSLIPRLRGHGKFTVQLRALDSSRKLSVTSSRSVNL